jgi:hypothetical protein
MPIARLIGIVLQKVIGLGDPCSAIPIEFRELEENSCRHGVSEITRTQCASHGFEPSHRQIAVGIRSVSRRDEMLDLTRWTSAKSLICLIEQRDAREFQAAFIAA